MSKKFFEDKEFVKLQSEWYDKLKDEGFEDIEYFSGRSAHSLDTPYLGTKRQPTSGSLRRRYSSQTSNHYRMCRNFLQNGPFTPILWQKYKNSGTLQTSHPTFTSFTRTFDQTFNRADFHLFRLYTEGLPFLEMSEELRRLYRLNKISVAKKSRQPSKDREPFSVFWVFKRVKELKIEMYRWNYTDSEGLGELEDDRSYEERMIDAIDAKTKGSRCKPSCACINAEDCPLFRSFSCPEDWEAGESEKSGTPPRFRKREIAP
jgi:hypothetical protein